MKANSYIYVRLSAECPDTRTCLYAKRQTRYLSLYRLGYRHRVGDGRLVQAYAIQCRLISRNPRRVQTILIPLLHNRHWHLDAIMDSVTYSVRRFCRRNPDIHHPSRLYRLSRLRLVYRRVFPYGIMLHHRRFFRMVTALPHIDGDAHNEHHH